MEATLTSLGAGVVFGLSAGFSPGPLLMLVISQTIRHGIREGAKVAFSPLVTDLPIILVSLAFLTRLTGFNSMLGIISLAGGVVVITLARETWRSVSLDIAVSDGAPNSLGKGALVNLLSPHPWLFWLTVGAPFILKGAKASAIAGASFAAAFLFCLVGAKILVAIAAGKSRHLLTGGAYVWAMRLLALLLLAYAFMLFRDGLMLLTGSC